MDHLDKAKERIAEAMGALEDALIDGLLAQAPNSNFEQVEAGTTILKQQIEEALAFVAQADVALEHAKQGGG